MLPLQIVVTEADLLALAGPVLLRAEFFCPVTRVVFQGHLSRSAVLYAGHPQPRLALCAGCGGPCSEFGHVLVRQHCLFTGPFPPQLVRAQ